jgi:long-chain fatty acid transport protein
MTRNDALAKQQPRATTRATRRTGACIAFALTSTLALSARASGFLNPRLADPHGHPALANPYAVYFNPAALGGIVGTQIVVDGTLVYRTVDFNRAPSALSPSGLQSTTDPTYVGANTGSAHAGNVLVIPFVAASSDFGRRDFFGGVGAYVPFGGVVKFDQNASFAGNGNARGAVDGTERWAVISATQESIYLTGVVGTRIPDSGLSFAIGGSLVLSKIVHNQARNLDGHDDVATEGRALLDVSSTDPALSAGVYWEVLPKKALRLGLSYSARPAFGEMRMRGTLKQRYSGESVKDVDFVQTYPDVIRMGLATRPWGDKVELRLDAEYATWSVFDRQCILERGSQCTLKPNGADTHQPEQIVLAIRRHWRDAGAVRAGLGLFVDDKTEIYGGVGYDTSAVTTQTVESTYPDAFKLIGSLGVRRQLSQAFALGVAYTHVYYLPVTTGHQQQSELFGVSRIPNEDGTYKSQVMFMNVNATFSF